MKNIKLSKWAKENSYTYQGAYLKHKRGDIEGSFEDTNGSIFVSIPDVINTSQVFGTAIIYSRCSSSKQRDDAIRQRERLTDFSISNGYVVVDSYIEIASGMNEERKILNKILQRNDFEYLVVENKDRLARFGFKYIEELLRQKNIKIIVVNNSISDEDELVQDLISIVTSFCARLYGRRRIKNKKEQIIKILKEE